MRSVLNPSAQPQIVRGRNFTYALPSGWVVAEEGNYGLALRAPDGSAGINVVGQTGLLYAMSPDAYAYSVMTGIMQLQNVQFANIRALPPGRGFTQAAVMDILYMASMSFGPAWLRGTVIVNVYSGYQIFGGVVTLAAALQDHWQGYASWLPGVALEAVNTGPNPYGSTVMGGVIGRIGASEAAAYAQYRTWSDGVRAQVGWERSRSDHLRSDGLGPVLTGQDWSPDPYGNAPQRRSLTPAVVWASADGREAQSDDPSFDPRTASDSDWRKVIR